MNMHAICKSEKESANFFSQLQSIAISREPGEERRDRNLGTNVLNVKGWTSVWNVFVPQILGSWLLTNLFALFPSL
jgi:hypothetical protein